MVLINCWIRMPYQYSSQIIAFLAATMSAASSSAGSGGGGSSFPESLGFSVTGPLTLTGGARPSDACISGLHNNFQYLHVEKHHAKELMRHLHSLYQQSEYCDLTIVVSNNTDSSVDADIEMLGGSSTSTPPIASRGSNPSVNPKASPDARNVIRAHRVVLMSASGYFSSMYASGMRESKENQVTLKDLPMDSVSSLVEFAYTGRIAITEENVQRLLFASSVLQVLPFLLFSRLVPFRSIPSRPLPFPSFPSPRLPPTSTSHPSRALSA